MNDFAALRRRFPICASKTYLNSGSCGALAESVQAAVDAYLQERLRLGASWDLWVAKLEAVRGLLARLLRAETQEIAITASASAGLNALASALDFGGPRNKVVTTELEFPTGAQIWHAQAGRGAFVVHVPADAEGNIPLQHFERHIDSTTRLVAVTHVCYRNGAQLDIPGIVRLARAHGALVLLDCYQSVGALEVDVGALDVDFAVGGMVKYLLGTAGIGFLYVRRELFGKLTPTHTGWFAQDDIAAMDIHANRPAGSARRFEAGTPPVINCYAAEAGLQLITEVGIQAIQQRIAGLTRQCLQGLAKLNWPSATPAKDQQHGPMVCIRATDAAELVGLLAAENIVLSCRDRNLRAMFHFYNNAADVAHLLDVLAARRSRYCPG